MWCILVVYSSSSTRLRDSRKTRSASDMASINATLCFIFWPHYNTSKAIQLWFLMHRCESEVY